MARYKVEIEEKILRTRAIEILARNKGEARARAMDAYNEADGEAGEIAHTWIMSAKAADVEDLDLPPEESDAGSG